MLSFVRRHRKKLVATTAVAGGLVLLGKLAESAFRRWQEEETKQLLERARRQHHFESTERTGHVTLQSLLPALKRQVAHCLDCEALVNKIRTGGNPEAKVENWEKLKVTTFARCAAYVLGAAHLALLLRMQLHLVGGYLYHQEVNRSSRRLSPRVQERFLLLSHLLVTRWTSGLLCRVAEEKVSERVGQMALKTKVGISDLETIFGDIMKMLLLAVTPTEFIVVTDLDMSGLDTDEKDVLVKLTAEARDVAEQSDLLGGVLTDCTGLGLSVLYDHLAECFGDHELLPLAKVLPMLNRFVRDDGHYRGRDPFFLALCSDATMKQFSANVYEAFCHDSADAAAVTISKDFFGLQRFIQRFV